MTGIKLLHKSLEGILSSFMGERRLIGRNITYTQETRPAFSCGPLALYEDTPEGMAAAMGEYISSRLRLCCAVS